MEHTKNTITSPLTALDAYLKREHEWRQRRIELDKEETQEGGWRGVFKQWLRACVPFFGVFALPGLFNRLANQWSRDLERSALVTESLIDTFNTLGYQRPGFQALFGSAPGVHAGSQAFYRQPYQPHATF